MRFIIFPAALEARLWTLGDCDRTPRLHHGNLKHFEKKCDQKYWLQADLRPSKDASLTQKVSRRVSLCNSFVFPLYFLCIPLYFLCIPLYLVTASLFGAERTPSAWGMPLWKDADQLVINIFGRNFFKSALDFHGGDDGRGDSPPKLIAVPQYVFLSMNYLIYRIDSYIKILYSSRQTRPLTIAIHIAAHAWK